MKQDLTVAAKKYRKRKFQRTSQCQIPTQAHPIDISRILCARVYVFGPCASWRAIVFFILLSNLLSTLFAADFCMSLVCSCSHVHSWQYRIHRFTGDTNLYVRLYFFFLLKLNVCVTIIIMNAFKWILCFHSTDKHLHSPNVSVGLVYACRLLSADKQTQTFAVYWDSLT